MATNINVPFTVEVGTPVVVPLDRYGGQFFTVQLTSAGSGTANIQGTTRKINQGETGVYATLDDAQGNALGAVGDPAIVVLERYALEAIQITATTATITGTVMQAGN